VFKELHYLAERLKKARIDDDYAETDLRTWTNILQKLKNDMSAYSSSISVEDDRMQTVIGRLYISTTTNQPSRPMEKFGGVLGNIRIDNNGCLAIHRGLDNGTASVRGVGEYLSGKYNIYDLV
jgi:hypothetical protein